MVPIQTPAGKDGSQERKLAGIIDIDCAVIAAFDEVDKRFLEQLAELIGNACDW